MTALEAQLTTRAHSDLQCTWKDKELTTFSIKYWMFLKNVY